MNRKSYSALYELLILGDCFFNWLAGGRGDVTISARVGYRASQESKYRHKWKKAEQAIDYAFEPIDGAGHCKQAYKVKPNDDYTDDSEYRAKAVLLFVRVSCPIIRIINSFIAAKH